MVTVAHLGATARMVFVGKGQAAQRLLAAKGRHSRHHFLLYVCGHPELAGPIVTHHLQCMQMQIEPECRCQLDPIAHLHCPLLIADEAVTHTEEPNAPHPFPNKC